MSSAVPRNPSSASEPAPYTAAQKRLLRRRLLAWYAKNARDLPWRHSCDPYRVWISEVMLQQTQVATVEPYFLRFLAAFRDVKQLAAAKEEDVLRLWEGLGYYRRARQLHAAARRVVKEYGGELPGTVEALCALPGVGRYTAGAIASIAFDKRAPILEANTIRLFSRLIAFRGDPTGGSGQSTLWQLAKAILPKAKVGTFNQALMELGSLVCTPSEPNCPACPLVSLCAAAEQNVQREIPRPKSRRPAIDVREAAVVVRRNGKLLMRRCGAGERWAGLWDFPRFAIDAEGPLFAMDELIGKLREQTGVSCRPGPLLKTLKHGVTHHRITLDCYEAAYVAGRPHAADGSVTRWISLGELPQLPLSTTGRKIARLAMQAGGQRRPRPATSA